MSYFPFPRRPYVPVAVRRQRVGRTLAKLVKGRAVSPVSIEGRAIARSFWSKSWCSNLERYSDFANRLPRGRTYVRNGSVVDLQIATSRVSALVSGSRLYTVTITIAAVTAARAAGTQGSTRSAGDRTGRAGAGIGRGPTGRFTPVPVAAAAATRCTCRAAAAIPG